MRLLGILAQNLFLKTPYIWDDSRPRPGVKERSPGRAVSHVHERRPREAEYYRQLGQEIGDSRMWAGIHYRSDIEAGWEMARKLFEKVRAYAESDGSQQ